MKILYELVTVIMEYGKNVPLIVDWEGAFYAMIYKSGDLPVSVQEIIFYVTSN